MGNIMSTTTDDLLAAEKISALPEAYRTKCVSSQFQPLLHGVGL